MATSTKSTNKKRELFLELFKSNGVNISTTCEKVGIDRKTYYNWCEKDKEFKEAVENIKEGVIDFAESKLMEHIESGDVTSLIFFLKTRGKARGYSERQEIQHSGSIENKIQIYLPKKEG